MGHSKEPFKNFVNNHKFTFVASLASILGFILTFTVFFPPQKRPFYSVKSFNLINNSSSTIENLDIKYKLCNSNQEEKEYKLKAIDNCTITKIFFWNGGREKIDKTDIDDNPIKIAVSENNSILKAKIIHSSNEKTNFRLNSENNNIIFDFLDSSNGGVIQVIHTGLSDEDITLDAYVEDSRFNGKIKRKKLEVAPLRKIDFIFIFFCTGIMIHHVYDAWKQKNSYILYMLGIILLWLVYVVYIINQSFLTKNLLRYPLTSYEEFNSEISR